MELHGLPDTGQQGFLSPVRTARPACRISTTTSAASGPRLPKGSTPSTGSSHWKTLITTAPRPPIGLQSITDGSSNTIAWGEGLVSISGRGNSYRGNGINTGTNTDQFNSSSTGLDVQQKTPQALADALAACNTFLAASAASGTTNHNGMKEFHGQAGSRVLPSDYTALQYGDSSQLETLSVELVQAGQQGLGAQRDAIRQRLELPPRRVQLHFRRWERPVRQGDSVSQNISLGSRHPELRRGDQLRQLLTPDPSGQMAIGRPTAPRAARARLSAQSSPGRVDSDSHEHTPRNRPG